MHDSTHHEPAVTDNLLLDIGGDIGALVIHTDPGRDQAEIEISPADDGADADTRTHNVARARQTPAGVRYAAVFPALAAGRYTVWADATTPAGVVTITGGTIADFFITSGAVTPPAPAKAAR
jgi:hypothetical protein